MTNTSNATTIDINDIIAFEDGLLNDEAVIKLFQRLVDTGIVWGLQGAYGRAAVQLIEAGLVTPKEEE
jgi:hypothetical protein